MRHFVLLTSLVFLCATLSGCTAVVGGVVGGIGTATWLSGKLGEEVDAPYEEAIEATKSGLSSLGMKVEKETKKDDIAQIISEHGDLPVWIDIRPATSSTSKIDVRVGASGNKDKSREILDAIQNNL